MQSLVARYRRLVADAFTPPFPQHLPSNVETFVAVEPVRKILWRRIRRSWWLAVNGQRRLERTRIEAGHPRILWIHSGMPQVGDSLMDLACRVLLRGRDVGVDLLIDPHLAPLYAADDVFARVHSDPGKAARNAYDLVIVLSSSAQSLRAKLSHFRRLPYVNLHGYYTGPEFHRTLFGFYRLDQLLGGRAREADVLPIARPHMAVSAEVRAAIDALGLPRRFIAVAVGGVRGWRTYSRWAEVIEAIRAAGGTEPVVLLGAANGLAVRDTILAASGAASVIDRVDRHSLTEVFEILRRSAVVAVADGGLLHVAHAAGAATVSLFAERIDPTYRLTPANRSVAFYSRTAVSDIAPAAIAEAVVAAVREPIAGVRVIRV